MGRWGPAVGWEMAAQPVVSHTFLQGTKYYPDDSFHVKRNIAAGFTFGMHATWFPSAHLGIGGELAYLAHTITDAGSLTFDGGDPALREACADLNGRSSAGNDILTAQFLVIARPVVRAVSTLASHGVQLMAEFRETSLRQPVVTGPATEQGRTPRSSAGHLTPSVTVTIDLLLRRDRSKRY